MARNVSLRLCCMSRSLTREGCARVDRHEWGAYRHGVILRGLRAPKTSRVHTVQTCLRSCLTLHFGDMAGPRTFCAASNEHSLDSIANCMCDRCAAACDTLKVFTSTDLRWLTTANLLRDAVRYDCYASSRPLLTVRHVGSFFMVLMRMRCGANWSHEDEMERLF